MKKLLTLILFLVILLALPVGVEAATYYVAATAIGAEDGSTVTDAMTVAALNATALGNADVVIIKSETTYTTAITLASANGATITLRASEDTDGDWGDGTKDKDTALPTLDGDHANMATGCVHITNSNISGLKISYLAVSGSEGIGDNYSVMEFYTLGDDIELEGITIDGDDGGGADPAHALIEIEDTNGTISVHDCTLYDNDVGGGAADHNGLEVYFSNHNICDATTTIALYDNTIYDIEHDCIYIAGFDGASCNVYQNTLYDHGEQAFDCKANSNVTFYLNNCYQHDNTGIENAIVVHRPTQTYWPNASDNIVVRDNYIHDYTNLNSQFTGITVSGIAANANMTNVAVYDNYFKNVEREPIRFLYVDGLDIYNNIFEIQTSTEAQNGNSKDSIIHGFFYGGEDIEIYNNTIWVAAAATHFNYGIALNGGGATFDTVTVKNNAIHFARNDNAVYPFYETGTTATLTIDTNIWYGVEGNIAYLNGTGYDVLATWNAVAGVGTDLAEDPDYNNAAGGQLYANGAAAAMVDAGTAIALTNLGIKDDSDYTASPPDVNTVSRAENNGADAGAYERVTALGGEDFTDIKLFYRFQSLTMDGTDDFKTDPDGVWAALSGAVINTDAKKDDTNGLDCPSEADYVRLDIDTDTVDPDEFRIGCWWRCTNFEDDSTIFRVYADADNHIYLYMDDSDELRVKWRQGATTRTGLVTTNSPIASCDGSTWYFIELVGDGDATAATLDIRVDGVSKESDAGQVRPTFTPSSIDVGETDSPGVAEADQHFARIICSDDKTRDFYFLKDVVDYGDLGAATVPTISEVGHVADPSGTPVYTADKTETWSTLADTKYVGLKLSEQIINFGNPYQSYLSLTPTYGTMVGKYHSQVLISAVYYLVYEFKVGYTWDYTNAEWDLAIGHRSLDLQTAAVGTALQLNTATMQDGDGNSLVTTLPGTDIGTITLANPKDANSPFEVKPSGGHATTLANLETAVGASGLFTTDVVLISGVTEATATATAAALYYIYSLTGDFDCDNLACTVRGTNRVSGSVTNSGSATLHSYNPPRVSN